MFSEYLLFEMFWNENKIKNLISLQIKWMKDGKLNICYNALDRHLDKKGSQVNSLLYLYLHDFLDIRVIYFPYIRIFNIKSLIHRLPFTGRVMSQRTKAK